jgi:MarR-like DNA-binding transcriptional regulator SgrR of sgrS sRNA
LCLLGLATSLVTGCSHDADSSGRSGDEAAPEAEDVEVTPNELAFEDPGPGPLSTIRLAMERPPGALPHEISPGVQEAVIVADLLYDGLTEAAGADGRLAGGLAVDWSANDELTEWTFSIDTDRIEPAVVVAHFEELLAERAADTGSGMLLAHVGGVELTSGSEVRFHLNEPVAAFPWLVSGVAISRKRGNKKNSRPICILGLFQIWVIY